MANALFGLWVLVLVGACARWALQDRARNPWRSTKPLTPEERYLSWVERHAKWEAEQRIKRVRRALGNQRRLYGDYDAASIVHVPAPRGLA